jgi:hypothetical protein
MLMGFMLKLSCFQFPAGKLQILNVFFRRKLAFGAPRALADVGRSEEGHFRIIAGVLQAASLRLRPDGIGASSHKSPRMISRAMSAVAPTAAEKRQSV